MDFLNENEEVLLVNCKVHSPSQLPSVEVRFLRTVVSPISDTTSLFIEFALDTLKMRWYPAIFARDQGSAEDYIKLKEETKVACEATTNAG